MTIGIFTKPAKFIVLSALLFLFAYCFISDIAHTARIFALACSGLITLFITIFFVERINKSKKPDLVLKFESGKVVDFRSWPVNVLGSDGRWRPAVDSDGNSVDIMSAIRLKPEEIKAIDNRK